MKYGLMGVAVLLASSTVAFGADLYQPPVEQPIVDQPVVAQPVASAGGWYLRGDVGYSYTKMRGAHFFQGSNGSVANFASAKVDNTWTGGIGVGYQATSYLRGDLTLDYFGKSDFRGSTIGSCGVSLNCTSRDITSFSALSLMANAYVDLGTYYSITPYVGGGIGGTRVKWDKLRNTSCDSSNPANCDTTVEHGGGENWRFTYALMAGASVDITCDLKADVGYRYRRVLGGNMFGYAQNGGPGYDKGFNMHEVRAGLRYSLGGCAEQVAYEPPPVSYEPPPVFK
ncbi:outer membrane protein [Rhizobium sp. SG2393]|uniref:outer membrane protein n=1 Tax=Rhizobium sp. SG2393 TaxID=3276279 RepID=UPI003670F377